MTQITLTPEEIGAIYSAQFSHALVTVVDAQFSHALITVVETIVTARMAEAWDICATYALENSPEWASVSNPYRTRSTT